MSTCIKIRGIYTTALTKLMLDAGYRIVDPSSKIRKLFNMDDADGDYEILVQDRSCRQGVELIGPPEKMTQCLTFLQEQLLDTVLLDVTPAEEETGMVRATLEFPGAAKQSLDEIRLTVAPTLHRHHRYRIIASKVLEQAEQTLQKHPERKESLEDAVFQMEILLPLEKEGFVRLEHIRPSGKPMRPREGVLVSSDIHGFTFRRTFSKGRYDGLDLPIREGDYGLTEIREGAWFVKHSYFTRDHELIGRYYNINTPVELYPYGARYLDLEVDVIQRAGEKPALIDREKLGLACRKGCLSEELGTKALSVAQRLMKSLGQ